MTQDWKGGKLGQLVYNDQSMDSIELIALSYNIGRVEFPPGNDFGPDVKPLCKSDDGLFPSKYITKPVSSKCGSMVNSRFVPSCPHAFWTADNKPGPCKDTRLVVVAVKDTLAPAFVQVKGTSIATFENEFIKKLNTDRALNRNKGLILEPYDYTFVLSAKKGNGQYYSLHVTDIKRVQTPGTYAYLFQEVLAYRAQKQQLDQEQGAEAQVNGAVGAVLDAEFVTEEIPF